MKLLTEELRKQLPPLYSQEHEPDPLVICCTSTAQHPDPFVIVMILMLFEGA